MNASGHQAPRPAVWRPDNGTRSSSGSVESEQSVRAGMRSRAILIDEQEQHDERMQPKRH